MFMKNRPMVATRIGPLDRWVPRYWCSTEPYVAAWISATTMTTAKIAVMTFCTEWIHR
jgi:hypothetical protein